MKRSIFMRVLFCKIHCPFICFCKPSSAHLYPNGPLKLENAQRVPPSATTVVVSVAAAAADTSGELSAETTEFKEEEDQSSASESDGMQQEIHRVLRSCIRKPLPGPEVGRKRVQWMDNLGKELVEIKEFESIETDGTDNEEDNRGCMCIIL